MGRITSAVLAGFLALAATGLFTAPAKAVVCPSLNQLTGPCADPGGPYSIVYGTDLVLDGSGSASPNIGINAWVWEFNVPTNIIVSNTPVITVSFSTLSSLGLGVGSYNIKLTIEDFFGVQASATTALNITTPVPEPGTLALFGFGLAGLGFARRHRRVARS